MKDETRKEFGGDRQQSDPHPPVGADRDGRKERLGVSLPDASLDDLRGR